MRRADYTHRRQRNTDMPNVAGCRGRNEIWQITVFGTPTADTFAMELNVLGTTETMTIDFDMSAADFETELETHSEIASGDVEVTGGPLPDALINIEFKGDLANHRMPPPTIDFSDLTGGTGVGVVLARYQPGHPTDGSVAP
jgi:hypothetical protein